MMWDRKGLEVAVFYLEVERSVKEKLIILAGSRRMSRSSSPGLVGKCVLGQE